MTTRQYIHELLHVHSVETKTQNTVRIFLAALILASIISVMLETVKEIQAEQILLFEILEIFFVVIFSIEYILRVWSAVEESKYRRSIIGRLKYMISPLSIIDLLAITPFYILGLIGQSFLLLRGFRLIKLLRIIKLGEYTHGFNRIIRVIHKKRHELQVTFFIIGTLLIISSSVMYFLERNENTHFSSIPASLWGGICTLTTVGYSSVEPMTLGGRFFTAVIMLLGVTSFTLPSGIVISGLVEDNKRREILVSRMNRCPHCEKELPEMIEL